MSQASNTNFYYTDETGTGFSNSYYIKKTDYTHRKLSLKISTQDDYVGIVLGRQYANLRYLKNKYKVNIRFYKANSKFPNPAFEISSFGKNSINIIRCYNHITHLLSVAMMYPVAEETYVDETYGEDTYTDNRDNYQLFPERQHIKWEGIEWDNNNNLPL